MLQKSPLIIVLLLLTTFALLPNAFSQTAQNQNQQYISAEKMQSYAQAVITTYNEYVSRYFPSSKGNFSFYSEGHSVKSFISYNGAAIWFEPSLIPSFKNYNLSERVESIFGGNFDVFPLFSEPGHHVIIVGGQYVLDGHPLLTLSNISSVIFEDIYVNQTNTLQAYKCVIIKGSLKIDYWTGDNATEDAGELFYNDVEHAFYESESVDEEIRERYAEPELLALVRNIQYKLANDTSYKPSQFAMDYKDLEYKAITKFHLADPTGFLNELLEFVNAQISGQLPLFPSEPTPTPLPTPTFRIFMVTIEDSTSWLYVLCLCILSSLDIILLVVFYDTKDKYPSKLVRVLLVALTALFGIVIVDLAEQPPSSYQLASPQTVVLGVFVVSVIIVGLFSVYRNKKKSINVVVADNKSKNQDKQNPDKETDESLN
jgi:hypothetical protein